MSQRFDAYAAGLVDGEGCISAKLAPTFVGIRVTIGMSTKAQNVLESMYAQYGGTLITQESANPAHSPITTWTVNGAEAAAFLRRIEPHLILKSEQARVALKIEEIRTSQEQIGNRDHYRWTPESLRRCKVLHRRLGELNARGRESLEVPTERMPFARLVAGQWVTPQMDLFSDLGWEPYSATWPRSGYVSGSSSVRASDTGACHGRERFFMLADAEGDPWIEQYGDAAAAADAGSEYGLERRLAATREATGGRAFGELAGRGGMGTLRPTPTARDAKGHNQRRDDTCLTGALLPALLPTPTATSYGSNRSDSDGAAVRKSLEYVTDWGKYATAIRRHEIAFGRPAPSPVQPSSKGTPQLAPVFTEWMMGLPHGWVTDPAIWEGMLNAKGKPASKAAIRNAQLHALGNGVVPQQAIYALRVMLSWRLAIRGAA